MCHHVIVCSYIGYILPTVGITRSRFSSCRSCCEQCTAYTPCVREPTDIHSPSKPKNARSKRALEAREPKEVEDPRTVIFVKGTHTGERLSAAMQELVRHKYPPSIPLLTGGADGVKTTILNLILKKEPHQTFRRSFLVRVLGSEE